MITNTSQIFEKIELLVKVIVNDLVMPSISKLEYKNAKLLISGNFLIITEIDDNEENTETSKIFNLDDVKSYRIHNKNKNK